MSNLNDAVTICRIIEKVAPSFGCHVALTGGTLYKDGERKDVDVLMYRIRQVTRIDTDGLFLELARYGMVKKSGFGWCYKLTFGDIDIDMFFPENEGGEYDSATPPPPIVEAPKPVMSIFSEEHNE